jgi:hypothetical protein
MRRDFERDVTVAASAFLPDRAKDIAAELNVGNRELFEDVEAAGS